MVIQFHISIDAMLCEVVSIFHEMSVSLQHHVNTASYQCYDGASTLI